MFKQSVCPTDQAVLKEVPPDTARELGKAKAEGEEKGQPEVVGRHLGKQTKWSATKILDI